MLGGSEIYIGIIVEAQIFPWEPKKSENPKIKN